MYIYFLVDFKVSVLKINVLPLSDMITVPSFGLYTTTLGENQQHSFK